MVIKLSEILKKIEIKNSGYVKSWKEESIFMDTKSLQLDTKDVKRHVKLISTTR